MSDEGTPKAPSGREGALADRLAGARSVKAACVVAVEHLADQPGLLPSLYLERGGRLRCQAVARYWQVFDGMPTGAGVIGRTFATGRPTVLLNTSTSDSYLEAVPGVRSEVCVPIRLGPRVIGALNVESERELERSMVPELERCAAAVAKRIERLGGLPAETRPERLARHGTDLIGLVETEAVLARALEAACDIAEMESAVIALIEGGRLELVGARGPHSDALRRLSSAEMANVADWVRASTSVYTIGEPSGRGFAGHEALRRAGAVALIVLSLSAGKGLLLLVDSAPIALATEDIGLLELLAAQTTSALATAAALGELRERAATDPLTGLGHHATFRAQLEEVCARPERRGGLALLVLDLDGLKRVNDTRGHQAGDRVLVDVATRLRAALRDQDGLFRIGGDEFAALVTLATPNEALAVADRLRRAVLQGSEVAASVGLALHVAEEKPEAFFARADGALYQAKHTGGNRAIIDLHRIDSHPPRR